MAEGQFTSTERVYVDKGGKRVDAKDTARHRLLVPAGGSIPMEEARKAGLLDEKGTEEVPDSDTDDTGESLIDAQEESARVQGRASRKAASRRK